MIGTIVAVKPDRGFGFIKESGGARQELFFHVSDLARDLEFSNRLLELRVEFELQNGPKGRRCVNVRPVD